MHLFVGRQDVPHHFHSSCPVILHFVDYLIHHILIGDHLDDKGRDLVFVFRQPVDLFVRQPADVWAAMVFQEEEVGASDELALSYAFSSKLSKVQQQVAKDE